jgi:integrase
MRAFLEMQPRTSEFLFVRGSAPIKDFRSAWKTACKATALPRLLFHDLRRTAARNLRRAGIPESVAMKITGHKTRSMFERYNIVDEEDIRDVGRKAEFFQ